MAEQTKKNQTGSADEFVEKVLKVRRVSKVITGGRRFAFSALVVVGDRQGRIGYALGKSREVSSAIAKASKKARANMVTIPMYKTTIPYGVESKYCASKVVLRSASKGTGVIAGGAVRAVMEAVGIQDVLTKQVGSRCSQNVVRATMDALTKLYSAKQLASLRGKTVKEITGAKDVAAQ
jgi:small subunit ribosomal protein S5